MKGTKMKKSKKDICAQKKKKLTSLHKMADTALNVVTSTIRNLNAINEKIDAEVREIETIEAELNGTKSEMMADRERNSKIVNKFTQLLED